MSARARRVCAENGCTALVYESGKQRCAEHDVPLAWQGVRPQRGTGAHKRLREFVLERAHRQCEIRGEGCIGTATDMDRVDATKPYSEDGLP